ncbi:hypothetical protein BCR39DRAFT_587484 [Naematelia encephala]|uniref:Thaumatin family-domain-containing protein n=1 Tax=Naematelia encephala TaxID=71784 RepID=A0A1Y2B9F0_9TREE|nr:hypothetical protein BCR39DRAFT_587484 [Naematelia encephala]
MGIAAGVSPLTNADTRTATKLDAYDAKDLYNLAGSSLTVTKSDREGKPALALTRSGKEASSDLTWASISSHPSRTIDLQRKETHKVLTLNMVRYRQDGCHGDHAPSTFLSYQLQVPSTCLSYQLSLYNLHYKLLSTQPEDFEMFTNLISLFAVLGAVSAAVVNPVARQSESHTVTLINNCGSGQARFLYQGNSNPQGSATIIGPLDGGVAWVDGFAGANCLSSGVNCGVVEFTLVNPSGANPPQNAVDYSLQTQGNHQYTYEMNAAYTNSASCAGRGPPGPCTGPTQASCPGAFVGSDTTDGTVYQCIDSNVGITITFC